jgi:anti-sigma regulatory factor (Ser/Thr protein kinase)
VSAARRFTQFLLADSSAAVDAAWATGELATNAIRYSRTGEPGGAFTVEVWRWRGFTQIQVTDAGGDGVPVLSVEDLATQIANGSWPPEGKMGLRGIGALAHRFGTYQHTDGSRVVWARFKSAPPTVVGSAR